MFLKAEERREFTEGGKLFHWVAIDTGTEFHDTKHVGSWLTCDACNPVQVVKAQPGTDAESLRAEYDAAKVEAVKLKERMDAITAKLKSYLTEATDGATRAALHVPGYQPMLLTYSEPWTVDSKRLKAEQPLIYVTYAKQGTRWTLTESKGGGE